ncbi:MAG: cupin domain-containing protein [Alphaproteobacteria bacterium]|nr:cupin domain-containing protein [Alphaproteobacteria bacterium]
MHVRALLPALTFALGLGLGVLAQADDGPAATVISYAQAPHRVAPNGKGHVRVLAQGKNAFLGELRMDAGGQVPPHRDPTEEYIHVLQGTGTLRIDGVEHALRPGDTVFMPADAEVSYQNGPEEMVALQVFAGPGPASKYEAWPEAPSQP